MIKLNRCDLCESANLKFIDIIQDEVFNENFNLYKCENCGLMFLNPILTTEEVLKYYTPREYVPSDFHKRIKEGDLILRIIKNFVFSLQKIYCKNPNVFRLFFFLFSQYVRGVKIIPCGKYLDIGCGNGEFLYNLKRINPSGEYYGVEPGDFDEEDVKAYGLKVFKGTLEKAYYPDNYFDVITLNHVFEHVPNPSETMKELKRILKPGGILIIAVPNFNSFSYKIFGKFHAQLDPPRHLFHYSDKILKLYASKFNFNVVKIRYCDFWDQGIFIDSTFNFIGSKIGRNPWIEFRKKKKGNVFAIVFRCFLHILLTPFTVLLNFLKLGNSVEMWMRK